MILAIPGVALFDTTLVMTSRLTHGRSPFLGGQDHTSHRLVYLGMSVRQAVITIYAAGIVLGGAAIVMLHFGPAARIAGVVGLLLAAAVAAYPLARAGSVKIPWSEAAGRQAGVPTKATAARGRSGAASASARAAPGPTVAPSSLMPAENGHGRCSPIIWRGGTAGNPLDNNPTHYWLLGFGLGAARVLGSELWVRRPSFWVR